MLANPRIVSTGRKMEFAEEGCLSFLKLGSKELILADIEVDLPTILLEDCKLSTPACLVSPCCSLPPAHQDPPLHHSANGFARRVALLHCLPLELPGSCCYFQIRSQHLC